VKGWKRFVLPVGIVVIAVPILAFAEASFDYVSTIVGQSQNHFAWTFRRFLVPWGILALLAPVVVLLARKLPLAGRRPLLTVAAHAGASVLIGATHLFLNVAFWKVFSQAPTLLWTFTGVLISRYMLQDVFLYWTAVGALQVFWHQRARREHELAQARLSAELAEARLAALQSRLEPHFLFNTLNTAVMLVRGDRRQQAVNVLLELSELLRTVLHGAAGENHQVPLEQEWEFVRRYLALEKARFEDRLTVEMELAAGLSREPVPFLILQPLVENALRHGIAQRTGNGPGKLAVVAEREGESLRLEVWDNGPGAAGGRDGVGLTNVKARLRELYAGRGGLTIAPAPGGGTVARVTIPLGRSLA
jgi:signal transduction histidine kinase